MSTRLVAALLLALVAALLLGFYRNAHKGPGRRKPSGGGLGWALIFLTSGRMPPPPPASQIEVELNGEKDRAASDPLRKPGDQGP
ncbi:MAG TPA: hypothetical protein VMB48_17140 [Steroidobacteraceae bacterium]|nr:hypothetical protein [Steroidobacteraceae bacterium]